MGPTLAPSSFTRRSSASPQRSQPRRAESSASWRTSTRWMSPAPSVGEVAVVCILLFRCIFVVLSLLAADWCYCIILPVRTLGPFFFFNRGRSFGTHSLIFIEPQYKIVYTGKYSRGEEICSNGVNPFRPRPAGNYVKPLREINRN